MLETSNTKYKTCLADPPWDINQKGKRGAASHYQLMSLDQIKAMPVADLCEKNAHLYLWVPNGLLQEGLSVIKAWGFTFRSPIYWIKPRLGSATTSAMHPRPVSLPRGDAHRSSSTPSQTGCSHRFRGTAISRKNSTRSLSGCRNHAI